MKNCKINIINKSKKWQELEKIKPLKQDNFKKIINKSSNIFLQKMAVELLKKTPIAPILLSKNIIEINFFLVSNAQIKKINWQFRGKNKPTNVLSFGYLEENNIKNNGLLNEISKNKYNLLGDIFFAVDAIKNRIIATIIHNSIIT